jgi:hypothetical protein
MRPQNIEKLKHPIVCQIYTAKSIIGLVMSLRVNAQPNHKVKFNPIQNMLNWVPKFDQIIFSFISMFLIYLVQKQCTDLSRDRVSWMLYLLLKIFGYFL